MGIYNTAYYLDAGADLAAVAQSVEGVAAPVCSRLKVPVGRGGS